MEQRNELASQPLLLTIPQVATKLGLSRAMVYNLINREGLPVIHLGRAVRVSTTSLQKWVEEREQSARLSQEEQRLFLAARETNYYAGTLDTHQERLHLYSR
jgi:excisionase family DNA binding protein